MFPVIAIDVELVAIHREPAWANTLVERSTTPTTTTARIRRLLSSASQAAAI
jgi:hypothetical protein